MGTHNMPSVIESAVWQLVLQLLTTVATHLGFSSAETNLLLEYCAAIADHKDPLPDPLVKQQPPAKRSRSTARAKSGTKCPIPLAGEYYVFAAKAGCDWNFVRPGDAEPLASIVGGSCTRLVHAGQLRNVFLPDCNAREFAQLVGVKQNQHFSYMVRGMDRRTVEGWCAGLLNSGEVHEISDSLDVAVLPCGVLHADGPAAAVSPMSGTSLDKEEQFCRELLDLGLDLNRDPWALDEGQGATYTGSLSDREGRDGAIDLHSACAFLCPDVALPPALPGRP